MAIEISWSDEAKEIFAKNVDFLLDAWTGKEVTKFIQQTEQVISRIQRLPESYPPGIKNKKYRKARLNRYIVLFYRHYKTKNKIVLLTFWNARQNPEKLKY
jgi:hypothetical protein